MQSADLTARVVMVHGCAAVATQQRNLELFDQPAPQALELDRAGDLSALPKHIDELAVCAQRCAALRQRTHDRADLALERSRVNPAVENESLQDFIGVEPQQALALAQFGFKGARVLCSRDNHRGAAFIEARDQKLADQAGELGCAVVEVNSML